MKKNIAILFALTMTTISCSNKSGNAPGSTASASDPHSCLDIYTANSSSASGTYFIDPDGASGPLAQIQVYCEMSLNGGGWTLVMKQKSNDGSTLQGDTAYWSSAATPALNDSAGNLNTSDQNLVSAAFNQISLTQMMLVASNEVTQQLQSITAASAFAAFQIAPTDFSDDTNATRPNWFINTNSYPNGNAITGARLGFNFRQRASGTTYCAARWGWTANQDSTGSSLGTSDSCGGLGGYGTQYGGTFMSSSKNIWQPATVLLYVK